MKKFLIATVVLLGSISLANAEQFRIGVSLMGAAFEADGAKEIFSGDHAGNRSSTKVTKTTADDKENAEGAFALGSVFAEFVANDQISVGLAYVPHSSESEEAVNTQNIGGTGVTTNKEAQRINKVKVAFEDLTTVYVLANMNDNVYAKLGYMQVEAITKENLQSGGSYGDTTLDGFTIGLGYNMEMGDGMFVRAEASYMDIDGATLTNANDSTKSVSADGITGYGAAVSIGKSF